MATPMPATPFTDPAPVERPTDQHAHLREFWCQACLVLDAALRLGRGVFSQPRYGAELLLGHQAGFVYPGRMMRMRRSGWCHLVRGG